jgi:hypothetical protein
MKLSDATGFVFQKVAFHFQLVSRIWKNSRSPSRLRWTTRRELLEMLLKYKSAAAIAGRIDDDYFGLT